MQESLQNFGYTDSPYERPNQNWVCGKLAEGCPCEIGPDKNGRCRADFECKPSHNGDRWHCTRSPALGGSCQDGPLPDGTCCRPIVPCQPKRSIRSKRNMTIMWLSFLTLGFLMLAVSCDTKQHFLSPGDLTYQHAQISECDTCHKAFGQGFSAWVHQALNYTSILDNNQQCLKCHEFDKHAADAHSLSKPELMQVANALEGDSNPPQFKKIACMSCHIEHHGSNASLVSVDRQNCALCHDLPIKHAQKVHPDFRHFPYRHRTGIIFDHNEHYNKHFFDNSGEKRRDESPDSCLSCHVIDANGIKMAVRGYEKNCADCHNSIFDDSEPFPVYSVPGLNTEEIKGVGNWPADSEAEITPFMKLLLSNKKEQQDLISELESDDLKELDEDKAVAWAWNIKELFYDVYQQGKTAVAQRLANAYNCQLNPQGELIQKPSCRLKAKELEDLIDSFPLSQFCSAQQEWFPNLASEVSAYQAFKGHVKTDKPVNSIGCEKLPSALSNNEENWSIDEFNLQHRTDKHEDPFLGAWLEATRNHQGGSTNDGVRKQIFTQLTSEEISGRCNFCHSIDKEKSGNFKINWSVSQWDPKRKDFIRFNHSGHLRNQKESVCNDCHQMNKQADYLASYKHNQPLQFQSNFITEKETCINCHAEAMNKNMCQTCHNYHVSGTQTLDMLSQNQMDKGTTGKQRRENRQ